ncbi:GFA family protein [Phenylobacterium sp.]|uniref:GFA family protein n=1 Tax=Phenylobacterium sp. TaxID=1871053 RepID=UPI0035B15C32
MLTGSCLCGAVAYEAEADLSGIIHCHCETCRKAHGAAFSSIGAVPKAAFRWTRGKALLSAYDSSPGKTRRFCSRCGSQLTAERAESDQVMLRLGCLDTPVKVERQWHIWRSDGASWYDPEEAHPLLPEGMKRE